MRKDIERLHSLVQEAQSIAEDTCNAVSRIKLKDITQLEKDFVFLLAVRVHEKSIIMTRGFEHYKIASEAVDGLIEEYIAREKIQMQNSTVN